MPFSKSFQIKLLWRSMFKVGRPLVHDKNWLSYGYVLHMSLTYFQWQKTKWISAICLDLKKDTIDKSIGAKILYPINISSCIYGLLCREQSGAACSASDKTSIIKQSCEIKISQGYYLLRHVFKLDCTIRFTFCIGIASWVSIRQRLYWSQACYMLHLLFGN